MHRSLNQNLPPELIDGIDGVREPIDDLRLQFGFGGAATHSQIQSGRRQRVVDWLGEGLRGGRPGRLASEYPLLFEREGAAFHLTLWRAESPVAYCTLWPVTFRLGMQRLRVGMISLVYTDPSERGNGYARRVVDAAVEHAEKIGLGLVLLWSDLEKLYASLGFDRAGVESLIVVDQSIIERALELAIREQTCSTRVEDPAPAQARVAHVEDWPMIERLRGHRTCQLELDSGELSRLRTIPDLNTRVIRDEDREVFGFAMQGRGDDLGEVIHEWGGDAVASLRCCLDLVQSFEPWKELFVLAPGQCNDRGQLPFLLRQAGARVVTQPLAFMRIASAESFASDIGAMLPESLDLDLQRIPRSTRAQEELAIRTPAGEFKLSQSHLLDCLFGTTTAPLDSAPSSILKEAFGPTNVQCLPLPFAISGLESI